ncbi:hypothetical protein [Micrococcoides hystricis]|uniref:MFS transporter permease n=1 Tax=Micrococcoides hystricis TaxID=1572761 RepID=A0ABV6P921_9MICC
MSDTPPAPQQPPVTRTVEQPRLWKYFWLAAAVAAIPYLVLFNFIPLVGAALFIALVAVVIGAFLVAYLTKRAGKRTSIALLVGSLSGLALSVPLIYGADAILFAAGGTTNAPTFSPSMWLFASPSILPMLLAAVIAHVRQRRTS